MDFLIIKEKEKLLSERAIITERKSAIIEQIKELSISGNIVYNYNKGVLKESILNSIGEDKLELRNQLAKEQATLEKKLSPINNRLKEIYEIENSEKNSGKILKEILKEILSESQMQCIFNELNNREMGLPPVKVSLGIDNSINQKQLADKYKKIAKESIDALILARKNISSVIDAGMEKFDKGYFLQVVSPLNRAIPTLSELEKTKRINHL